MRTASVKSHRVSQCCALTLTAFAILYLLYNISGFGMTRLDKVPPVPMLCYTHTKDHNLKQTTVC